ncbi:MAG: PilC/PilY family type IV pilus protein, partial [Betaproteobacteria bacterium]
STSLNTGSRIYQARFNSNDWSGQLLSFTIDTSGVIAAAPEWDAGQNINSILPTNRNIVTTNRSVSPPVAIPFRWASLNASQQAFLNRAYTGVGNAGVADGNGSLRVDYLRGDGSNEGFGTNNFRRRINSKLGDIVNSNPQYLGPPSGTFSDASYVTFKTTYANRPPMIFVGANDGMLHGFDASQTSNKGNEVFGYIPSNVFYKLSWLTASSYPHRYFVDGTPITADVKVNGSWKTILVSTQAAGGQSLVVLDVTDPQGTVNPYPGNRESNANSWVLFEFRDSDESLNRIGYIFGQPQIAQMSSGKWAIIVGNGYNHSYSCPTLPCTGGDEIDTAVYPFGRANMYVFFIEDMINNKGAWVDGRDYVHFNTLQGTSVTPNGFTQPALLDTTGNGTIDYIYAGDLLGYVWKFDVTNANPALWGSSAFGTTGGSPVPFYRALDQAGNPQIITAPPVIGPHPNGGYIVLFGTGRYLQPADPNPAYTTNTFYGLWDKQSPTFIDSNVNPSAGPISTSVSTRNSTLLQQQTFIANVTVNGILFRVTSQNSVNWSTQRGWYIDFPSSSTTGERSVVSPLIRNGKAIITSLVPSTASCDAGGTGYVTDLDAVTGGRLNASPFDVNGDRNFTSGDQVTVTIAGVPTLVYVSSRQSQVGITPTPTVISGGAGKEFKVTSGSTGGRESILENPGGATTSTTRRMWREILTN